ncbi:MAG: hypothetical protein EA402_14260 [Planctomycetota bacterium]|nr:MAG: hypothetical protein EA402_14260 [Planctomycetota bacterium]
MEYIRALLRYGMVAGLVIAIIIGIRIAPSYKSTVAPHDYRDMREVPRYATVSYDGSLGWNDYRIGDLIVFTLGDGSTANTLFGWIGGRPGDRIGRREGNFYINGDPLNQTVDQNRTVPGQIGASFADGLGDVNEITIPANHFYIVSDGHRTDSTSHGLFPATVVLGRATRVRHGE